MGSGDRLLAPWQAARRPHKVTMETILFMSCSLDGSFCHPWRAETDRACTHSESVKGTKAHVGLHMFMLVMQIAVFSLNRERDSRIIRHLVQEPAASKKDVPLP